MIKLYYQIGGSVNHGCEAIVKSTVKLLGVPIILYSYRTDIDKYYEIDKIVDLKSDAVKTVERLSFKWILAALYSKIKHSDFLFTKFEHEDFFRDISKKDICLSIGGDNYCYSGQENLWHYNYGIHLNGGKTVLWGCSIEPRLINDDIKRDLSYYDLIVARESISYNVLKKINRNTILSCDPAFFLDKKELSLPNAFISNKTIGINISPLIVDSEKIEGIVYSNYIELIKYIIDRTDYNIALIPHVVQVGSDDRETIFTLYKQINDKKRVCVIDDCNCEQLKGYISRCSILVASRTHASIAGYSSYVPTLVVGYSTKAMGIARDLFGSEDKYVISAQSLKHKTELVEAFKWIDDNQICIRKHLHEIMPKYLSSMEKAKEVLERL